MGTNTILRNVLLLEGKDYTPEQIDDILKNKPVTMTIHEAITLNNRLQAINYATNIADRFKQILVDYYESTSDRLKDFLKECIIRSSPVEFIVHDGAEYAVQDIISELPFSVRSQYQTDKECAMDFIEAYLAG